MVHPTRSLFRRPRPTRHGAWKRLCFETLEDRTVLSAMSLTGAPPSADPPSQESIDSAETSKADRAPEKSPNQGSQEDSSAQGLEEGLLKQDTQEPSPTQEDSPDQGTQENSPAPGTKERWFALDTEESWLPGGTPESWLAQDTQDGSLAQDALSSQDQEFLLQAVQGDQQEIILGSVAQILGESEAVRQFGKLLARDHARLLVDAMPLLNESGLSLPGLSSDQLEHIQQISSQRGEAFDRAFVDFMVEDHTMDVESFQQEITQGTNAQVQAYAERGLPTIEKHLAIAQALQRIVENDGTGSGADSSLESGGSSRFRDLSSLQSELGKLGLGHAGLNRTLAVEPIGLGHNPR